MKVPACMQCVRVARRAADLMLPFQGIHLLLHSCQAASILCCSVALHFLIFQGCLLLLNCPLCLHFMYHKLRQVTRTEWPSPSGLRRARAEVGQVVANWPMCCKSSQRSDATPDQMCPAQQSWLHKICSDTCAFQQKLSCQVSHLRQGFIEALILRCELQHGSAGGGLFSGEVHQLCSELLQCVQIGGRHAVVVCLQVCKLLCLLVL